MRHLMSLLPVMIVAVAAVARRGGSGVEWGEAVWGLCAAVVAREGI